MRSIKFSRRQINMSVYEPHLFIPGSDTHQIKQHYPNRNLITSHPYETRSNQSFPIRNFSISVYILSVRVFFNEFVGGSSSRRQYIFLHRHDFHYWPCFSTGFVAYPVFVINQKGCALFSVLVRA